MSLPAPRGSVMLLLHGSASHGGMWRGLRSNLESCFETIAPDLIGYGTGPAWTEEGGVTLDDEIAWLVEHVDAAPNPVHLVGYSYGGAVALALAAAREEAIASLTLVEPVAFPALLLAHDATAYRSFRQWQQTFEAELAAGSQGDAMRGFVDAWSGAGAWDALGAQRQADMVRSASRIAWDWQASFAARIDPAVLNLLGPKTLLLRGDRSPAPMIALVNALHRLMTCSRLRVIPQANHLLPITHPAQVAEALRSYCQAPDCGYGESVADKCHWGAVDAG